MGGDDRPRKYKMFGGLSGHKGAGPSGRCDDERPESPSADDELGAQQRQGMIPWKPKASLDICRTYGHVFRLLQDPHVQKASPGLMQAVAPHKKTKNRAGAPDRPASSSRCNVDSVVELSAPQVLAEASKAGGGRLPSKNWESHKSSPALLTLGGVSTTAGSWRNSSSHIDDFSDLQDTGAVAMLPPLGPSSRSASAAAVGLRGHPPQGSPLPSKNRACSNGIDGSRGMGTLRVR